MYSKRIEAYIAGYLYHHADWFKKKGLSIRFVNSNIDDVVTFFSSQGYSTYDDDEIQFLIEEMSGFVLTIIDDKGQICAAMLLSQKTEKDKSAIKVEFVLTSDQYKGQGLSRCLFELLDYIILSGLREELIDNPDDFSVILEDAHKFKRDWEAETKRQGNLYEKFGFIDTKETIKGRPKYSKKYEAGDLKDLLLQFKNTNLRK